MPTCDARSTRRPTRDAVADLHQVVDLRARLNARLADGRSIDGRVRANLHVVFDDDVRVLRNLQMGAVGLLGEAEPVAADDRAVLHDDAIADDDPLANRDVRMEDAVVADARAATDDDIGIDDRARADGGAGADDDKRTDRHVSAQRDVRCDGAERVDSPGRRAALHEQRDRMREHRVRIGDTKDAADAGGRT